LQGDLSRTQFGLVIGVTRRTLFCLLCVWGAFPFEVCSGNVQYSRANFAQVQLPIDRKNQSCFDICGSKNHSHRQTDST
jgi:hypothetical protein